MKKMISRIMLISALTFSFLSTSYNFGVDLEEELKKAQKKVIFQEEWEKAYKQHEGKSLPVLKTALERAEKKQKSLIRRFGTIVEKLEKLNFKIHRLSNMIESEEVVKPEEPVIPPEPEAEAEEPATPTEPEAEEPATPTEPEEGPAEE